MKEKVYAVYAFCQEYDDVRGPFFIKTYASKEKADNRLAELEEESKTIIDEYQVWHNTERKEAIEKEKKRLEEECKRLGEESCGCFPLDFWNKIEETAPSSEWKLTDADGAEVPLDSGFYVQELVVSD